MARGTGAGAGAADAGAGFAAGAPYQSGGLTMAPTSYNNIQILVPPQAGNPGSATGKTAAPISTQTAGVSFNPTIRAVDRFFNGVPVQPAGLQLGVYRPLRCTFCPPCG